MTCIVSPLYYPTKKSFREAIERDPKLVAIFDPSIFDPRYFTADSLHTGDKEFVTNHPRRTWFAMLVRRDDRTLKVE